MKILCFYKFMQRSKIARLFFKLFLKINDLLMKPLLLYLDFLILFIDENQCLFFVMFI